MKYIIWAASLIIISLLVIQCIFISKQKSKEVDYVKLIDSINIKIDSLQNKRDSLILIVDTNKVKIIEVEKRYETIRDRIITQSVDSDCITFSNYLSNYQRLSGNNNSTTVKNN